MVSQFLANRRRRDWSAFSRQLNMQLQGGSWVLGIAKHHFETHQSPQREYFSATRRFWGISRPSLGAAMCCPFLFPLQHGTSLLVFQNSVGSVHPVPTQVIMGRSNWNGPRVVGQHLSLWALPEGSSSGYFMVYLAHFQSEVREYQTIAIASMGQ